MAASSAAQNEMDAPATRRDSSSIDDVATDEKQLAPSRTSRALRFIRGVPPPDYEPGPPPDGGLQAWTQCLCGHLITANTWGFLTAFGAFQTYFSNDYLRGQSQSNIAWIGSFEIFSLMFLGAFTGRALDAGWFRPCYFAGGILFTLGTFTLSAATTYWQIFLSQAVAVGFGSGLMFVPAISLVATYFDKNKVLCTAIVLAGSGSGGMIWPAIVSQLIDRIGFPWTIRIIAFIMVALWLFTLAFFKPRLPARSAGPLIEWSAFKDPGFMFYVLGYWFCFFALYFPFYYVGAYARNVVGVSYQDSVKLLITVNGVGIPGRLIPALMADRLCGPLNVILPSALVSGVLIYAWTGIKTPGALYAFVVLYGYFANGVQGLWPGGIARMTPDIRKTGSRVGMGFSMASFALLTGPPIAGALIERDGGEYLYAQMWAGASLVLGVCFLVVARTVRVGWVLRVKV